MVVRREGSWGRESNSRPAHCHRRDEFIAEKYLHQLIESDLAMSDKARTTSLDELAAPFREALAGVSG